MALITDMGVTTGAGGIAHPMVKNKWRVDFYNFGGERGAASGTVESDILTLQAITGDRPKLTFDDIVLDRYNSRGWIAGKHTWEPVTFAFESDIGGRTSQVFQQQLEKQQALIAPGAGRLMNSARSAQDYKFGMLVSIMDGDITVLEQWAIEGVFINNIDYDNLDMAASEVIKITATFRYDHARQLIFGADGKATGVGMAPMGPLQF